MNGVARPLVLIFADVKAVTNEKAFAPKYFLGSGAINISIEAYTIRSLASTNKHRARTVVRFSRGLQMPSLSRRGCALGAPSGLIAHRQPALHER
jgi:hypothetical protein